MQKKLIALLLAVMLVLSLAAAGVAYADTTGDLEPGVNGEVVISHWGGATADA